MQNFYKLCLIVKKYISNKQNNGLLRCDEIIHIQKCSYSKENMILFVNYVLDNKIPINYYSVSFWHSFLKLKNMIDKIPDRNIIKIVSEPIVASAPKSPKSKLMKKGKSMQSITRKMIEDLFLDKKILRLNKINNEYFN